MNHSNKFNDAKLHSHITPAKAAPVQSIPLSEETETNEFSSLSAPGLLSNSQAVSLCPYFSEKFLSLFSAYSGRFRKERTKREYLYAIAALCNFSGCDFLDLREEHIVSFFQSRNHALSSMKAERVSGNCEDICGFVPPEDGLSPLPDESMRFHLRIYLAFARYIDCHAEQYGLVPIYAGLFSAVELLPQEMEFSSESLPSLSQADRVLAWLRENNDFTTFAAVSLALRCALTVQELVSLRRFMFFTDAKGRTGLRLPMTDARKKGRGSVATGEEKTRVVKLPEDAAEVVRLLTAGRPAGEESGEQSLLLNKYGRPLTARSLQMRLREACLACQISPFTMNELRTLGIALMLKGGASVSQAAAYTGTKNTDWFFRYNRLVTELDDSAADYSHLRIVP